MVGVFVYICLMQITTIIPCKGRLHHLKDTIDVIARQSIAHEVVIVDYDCPDGTYQWAQTLPYPNVRAVKADTKGSDKFNLSRARNEGVRNSKGDILFFCDADTLLSPVFLSIHLSKPIEGFFYCGWGYGESTGNLIVQRAVFEQVRGYNEALKGWGFEDIDIYNRMEAAGYQRRPFIGGTRSIQHGDDDRVKHYENANLWQTNKDNSEITNFEGL